MAEPTTAEKRAALDAAFAKRKARANALAEATKRNIPDLVTQGPGAVADALKDAYGLGERYLRSRTPGGVVADVAGGARALRDATTRYATDRAQNPMKVLADAYGVGKDIVTAVPQAVEDVAKLSERAQALKASDPEAARRLQASIAMAALGVVPGVRKGKQAVKAAEKTREARKLTEQGLYSYAAEVAAQLPQAKGTPDQMKAMLLRQGVKPAEVEQSGYNAAFAGRPSVTKQELAQHFETNLPKITETAYSADDPNSALDRFGSGLACRKWQRRTRAAHVNHGTLRRRPLAIPGASSSLRAYYTNRDRGRRARHA